MTMEKLGVNELTLSQKCMLLIPFYSFFFFFPSFLSYFVYFIWNLKVFQDEETSSVTNPVKRPLIEEIKKATHRKCIFFLYDIFYDIKWMY